MSQYRILSGGAGWRTIIFLRRLRNGRFVIRCGGLPRGLGHVPKPSGEYDHLDKEYKGRNGTTGSVTEPDGFLPLNLD
jgi:hypothetical protein